MWPPPTAMNHGAPPLNKLIAVAIDKDRGSQIALKWAVDNLLARGQTIILIHVKVKASGTPFSQSGNSKSLFLSSTTFTYLYDFVDQPNSSL